MSTYNKQNKKKRQFSSPFQTPGSVKTHLRSLSVFQSIIFITGMSFLLRASCPRTVWESGWTKASVPAGVLFLAVLGIRQTRLNSHETTSKTMRLSPHAERAQSVSEPRPPVQRFCSVSPGLVRSMSSPRPPLVHGHLILPNKKFTSSVHFFFFFFFWIFWFAVKFLSLLSSKQVFFKYSH